MTKYLWLGIFNIKLKYFSKKSYLMIHWEKQNMLYVSSFKKVRIIFDVSDIQNEAVYIEFIEEQ